MKIPEIPLSNRVQRAYNLANISGAWRVAYFDSIGMEIPALKTLAGLTFFGYSLVSFLLNCNSKYSIFQNLELL